MERTMQDKIFDPFFSTKEVGKGTGLGLSTVYGIVKQHNGYIVVDSAPNIGTVFRLYLPLAEGTGKEVHPAPAPLKGGKETILVAEDDHVVRNLMKDVLSEFGYTVIAVNDGLDAIEQFGKSDAIDLLILDSVMPKKNGWEAYGEIYKLKPDMNVIFTSGYTRDVFLDKGIEDNKFNFLQKPISPDTLLEKVRKALDERKAL